MINKTDLKSDDIEGTLFTAQNSAEPVIKVADELADCDGDPDTKLANKNMAMCQSEETSQSNHEVDHQDSNNYCRKRSCSELVSTDTLVSAEYTGNVRCSSTSVLNASDSDCCLNTKRQYSESNDRKDNQYQSNLISNLSYSPAITNTSIFNEINSTEETKNIKNTTENTSENTTENTSENTTANSETDNNRSLCSELTDINLIYSNHEDKKMSKHVSRTLSQRRPKLARSLSKLPVKKCSLSLPNHTNYRMNNRLKVAKLPDSSDDSSVIVLSSRESSPSSIDLERRNNYPYAYHASSLDYHLNNISPVYSDDDYDDIAEDDQEYDDFDNYLFASLPRIECEDTKSIPSASSISSSRSTSPSCYDSLDDSVVMVVQSSDSSDESQSVIFLSSRDSSPSNIDLMRMKTANVINTCQSTAYNNKVTDDEPLLVDKNCANPNVESTEETGCCDPSNNTSINKKGGSTKSKPNKNGSFGSHKSFSEDSDNRDR